MNKIKEILNKYKIIKFIFVGGTSTCIDFIIYMILSNFMQISISKSISMIISCIYSFFLNRSWTFQDSNGNTVRQIVTYSITQVINIFTNVFINQIVYNITNTKIVAYIVATMMAMFVNYILQKKVVFKGGKK